MMLAFVAALVTPAVAAAMCVAIGAELGANISLVPTLENNLSLLTPVRDSVLIAEIAGWAGTILGIWAFVQGIIAIRQQRGRGAGITAVVFAVLGPVIFAAAGGIALLIGIGAGAV